MEKKSILAEHSTFEDQLTKAALAKLKNTTEKELTFGQKLMGVKFNPSNREDVDFTKASFAKLADLVEEDFNTKTNFNQIPASWELKVLMKNAITQLINAQMAVVKVLTFES